MSTIELFLANPIVAQLVGLLVGLFTSFFSWWLLFHWLAPEVETSTNIAREKARATETAITDASGLRYRFKLRNIGRRAIVDLQVSAVVRIRGLVDPASRTWEIVRLPMNSDGDRTYSLPRIDSHRRSKLQHILRLYTHQIEECKHEPFPETTRSRAVANKLTLDDLLSLGSATEIRIFVSGYDEFSGARKVFLFSLRPDQVRTGRFGKGSMSLLQESSPSIDEDHDS
jgi:hypothetical protein